MTPAQLIQAARKKANDKITVAVTQAMRDFEVETGLCVTGVTADIQLHTFRSANSRFDAESHGVEATLVGIEITTNADSL